MHHEEAGRLKVPHWGEHDPQAKFVRGFGSIHTRNKSGVGFEGENYYADANNVVRYPGQTFISALVGHNHPILMYPIYRRFFFDGIISGRFELGFRMNMPTIDAIEMIASYRQKPVAYDAVEVAKQALQKMAHVNILDGRTASVEIMKMADFLRDAYLISSTKSSKISQYDIASVGSKFVSVGHPFVNVRAGEETPLVQRNDIRPLYSSDFKMFGGRTGHHGREIDTMIIASSSPVLEEAAKERFARLFYTQMRALCFSHSFYLKQLDAKEIEGKSSLQPAVASMLSRLKGLVPLEGDVRDAEVCAAMSEIATNSDVDPARLALEVEKRVKVSLPRRILPPVFKFLDKKADIAIEAAASTATKLVLGGGP